MNKTLVRNSKGQFKKGSGFWTGKKRPGLKTSTQFKKGEATWNKGKKCPQTTGELNGYWKGDKVGYTGIHAWVVRSLGKPIKCSFCEKKTGRLEWANRTGLYLRDLKDWIQLCKKCHIKYDRERNSWGKATKLWKQKNKDC